MWSPFGRPGVAPADVLARVPLGSGEKVLAAAASREGAWLLGTRDALYVVTGAGSAGADGAAVVRVAWEEVERADWNRDEDRLRVVEVGRFGSLRPVHEFRLDDPGTLLQLVRERVSASVVLQRRVVVSGRKGLFVVARRAPRGGGEITWAYEFDRGVDPDDPAVMAAAEAGLRRAQEETGV